MSTPLTERISAEHAEAERERPAADAARPRRRAAIERLAAVGLPTLRDENWKYANLRPLERARFSAVSVTPAADAGSSGDGATRQALASSAGWPAPLPGFNRYVFLDGVLAPALSAPAGTAHGAVDSLTRAGSSDRLPQSADERFGLLNAAFATDGAAIRVATRGTVNEAVQVELLFVASAPREAGTSYPRVEVQLSAATKLVLIERHLSAGTAGSFVNSAVTVELAPGASLQHYRLQELSAQSSAFDTLSATLAQDAVYRLHGISTGAQSARSTVSVRLEGQRADLTLAAVALGDRQQVQDAYARIEHVAPLARTEEIFRGIAAGRARVAFNGKIVVAPGAHGTDSRQSLRGLLAGPQAEIDVRPQLEIYTDDVRCSHGATAGKLDDNMLFYLLARGLDRETAERALKWAFLEDVIARIEVAPLRRQIEERLAGRMEDGAVLRELI